MLERIVAFGDLHGITAYANVEHPLTLSPGSHEDGAASHSDARPLSPQPSRGPPSGTLQQLRGKRTPRSGLRDLRCSY